MNRLERNQEREKEVTDLEYLKNVTLKVSTNKRILLLQIKIQLVFYTNKFLKR